MIRAANDFATKRRGTTATEANFRLPERSPAACSLKARFLSVALLCEANKTRLHLPHCIEKAERIDQEWREENKLSDLS